MPMNHIQFKCHPSFIDDFGNKQGYFMIENMWIKLYLLHYKSYLKLIIVRS